VEKLHSRTDKLRHEITEERRRSKFHSSYELAGFINSWKKVIKINISSVKGRIIYWMMEMQKYNYFVAHEFSERKRDDLRSAIEEAFRKSGLKAYYADKEIRQKHILEKIEERIRTTQFGIYDVTNGNPNVCLELGIARGWEKPYYIILEKGSGLPADLQGLDRIEYKSYKHLTEELKRKVVPMELDRLGKINESLQKEHFEEIPEREVLEKCCKLYQAEEMLHRFGWKVEDDDAQNEKAWFADLSELRGHIVYGPYESLLELGEYVAFFKMKIDDNSSSDPLLILDVTGGGFASSIVRGISFHKPNKYQLFGVKFKCQKLTPMEYRVFNQLQRGKVWIDYVAIVKSPCKKRGDIDSKPK
jgi:hypothetical protein